MLSSRVPQSSLSGTSSRHLPSLRHRAVRQPLDWEAEEVEAVQVRPSRQDAPAQGRPAPDAPDVAPVANSPTEVLSFLSGTRCPSRSSARTAHLYKFQRSGELGERRGSPTIDGTARQAGAPTPSRLTSC